MTRFIESKHFRERIEPVVKLVRAAVHYLNFYEFKNLQYSDTEIKSIALRVKDRALNESKRELQPYNVRHVVMTIQPATIARWKERYDNIKRGNHE